MFGLTKREQRWAAEQKAAEVIIPALTKIVEASLAQDTNDRIATLTRELAEARLEITALTLVNKMRPAPQADMVPAEELAEARAEVERLKVDAERYRWLKECTNEQFDHLSGQWCALDLTIDVMMKIERNGKYASTSVMKCQHVFDDDQCVICGGLA
jgi:hypothetical protein